MNEEFPLLSIVTPSYNQAAFLEATIRSVLEQDYPRIEYIIYDGGSSDNSVEIIQKYAGRLAYWHSEPDKGQADAINRGFARATGEYIAWINSDDIYLPGAFASAVRVLQADPSLGMVYGDVLSIDSEGKPFYLMTYGDWGLQGILRFQIIGQPGVFMRRSVLEKAGYLDMDYHYMLDTKLWLQLGQHGGMRYIPERWAAARIHGEAKNVSQALGFVREADRLMEWIPTQPALAEKLAADRRRIVAGVERFKGRYLLDGGQPWKALKAYMKSLVNHPATALKEWHRMVYSVACLLGLKGLRTTYINWRTKRLQKRGVI